MRAENQGTCVSKKSRKATNAHMVKHSFRPGIHSGEAIKCFKHNANENSLLSTHSTQV